jgi:hypothetical protein
VVVVAMKVLDAEIVVIIPPQQIQTVLAELFKQKQIFEMIINSGRRDFTAHLAVALLWIV